MGALAQPNIQSGFTLNVANLPITFDVASAGSRVVLALGTTSLNDALASTDRLGDRPPTPTPPRFSAATSSRMRSSCYPI